jgi:hypothetical protein
VVVFGQQRLLDPLVEPVQVDVGHDRRGHPHPADSR